MFALVFKSTISLVMDKVNLSCLTDQLPYRYALVFFTNYQKNNPTLLLFHPSCHININFLPCRRPKVPTTMPWQRFMLDWLLMEMPGLLLAKPRAEAKEAEYGRAGWTKALHLVLC
jgi:hypothetical protein